MVIMSEGRFRSVITSKSINFDLMSPREREGFGLLEKHEFERWAEIQKRGFAAVSAQHDAV